MRQILTVTLRLQTYRPKPLRITPPGSVIERLPNADGHHRAAAALLIGHSDIMAEIVPAPHEFFKP